LESKKKQRSKKKSSKAVESTTTSAVDASTASGAGGGATGSEEDGLDKAQEEKKSLLMELFTQSGEAKLATIIPHITEFLSDPLAGKLLIFGHHRPLLDKLQEHISSLEVEFIRIDGRTSSKERQARVQTFQNSSTCRVGILSITAAGVALTLTAAATVYFAEIFWTPGSLIQAEDRAHRIGQNNAVSVTYFLADGTIDEILWPLVRQKIKTLGEVVEGHENVDINAVKASSSSSSSASSESKIQRTTSSSADGGASTDIGKGGIIEDEDVDVKESVHIDDLEGKLYLPLTL
jgi:SWI/SNF-related matrix-associated actin-dependent regulator of chromatin subfamily A-like protein 1